MSKTSKKIAELNDMFRQTGIGGKIVMTVGVQALGREVVNEVMTKISAFKAFSKDNDPYGEHDFGVITVNGEKIFWKICYYDRALEYGSPDPSDPVVTCRVMTVMTALEY
ncbi:MAG: DUF3768 domain-containing protein [Rhodospirillaceae bacterium]